MVKQLCLLLGYDLAPEDEKGGMDDTLSFIEMATGVRHACVQGPQFPDTRRLVLSSGYMIDGRSPLRERQPEFVIYMDMAMR